MTQEYEGRTTLGFVARGFRVTDWLKAGEAARSYAASQTLPTSGQCHTTCGAVDQG